MITLLIALAVLTSQPGSTEQSVEIYAALRGNLQHCEVPRSAALVEGAIEALRSSSYESSARQASQYSKLVQTMDSARLVFHQPEFVRMKFSTKGPTAWRTVAIDELIIAASGESGPAYVLVKANSRVRAFSKYSPAAIDGVLRAISEGGICR
jgi:hypothetical protein